MRYKVVVLGSLLACSVLGSVAMTLGRARGAAWIGQPLSLTVPVQLDAGQTAATLCPEADVFYAEHKVETNQVTVAIEPTAQLDSVNVRITSTVIIDEPVVTLYLRAGCSQKTTRKFVLLADFPTETVTPVLAAPAAPLPVVPALVNPESPATANTGTRDASTTATPAKTAAAASTAKTNVNRLRKTDVAPSTKPEVARPSAPSAAAPEPATSRPAKALPPAATKATDGARSRLKLDPLENLAERIKTLEATTSTVPLEEMVKDSQRIQQLQTDVKALLDQAAKNEASLLAMRLRMEKAESERVSMGIVWALGALVLVCLAAIAALWTRNRKTELSAWQQSVQEAVPGVTPLPEPLTAQPMQDAPSAAKPFEKAVPSVFNSTMQGQIDQRPLDVDVNLMDMDSDFSRLIGSTSTPHDTAVIAIQPLKSPETNFSHPNFYAEDLIDVRQQAEFFQKLGKLDLSIAVLEQRIQLGSRDTALLYLDLLHIAHTHELKTDFKQFRDEFQKSFNVNVPEFILFRNTGRSLESFPSLMQHICQSWPKEEALELIESCVMRDPSKKDAASFDLEAFNELITLHGVLSQILFPANTPVYDGKPSFGPVDIET